MRTTTSIIALTLLATGVPAAAANGNWRIGNDQVHVVDTTIDVGTAAGRARLLARIEKAAQTVCRERVGWFRDACEVEAVHRAARESSAWGRALAIALQERPGPSLAAN